MVSIITGTAKERMGEVESRQLKVEDKKVRDGGVDPPLQRPELGGCGFGTGRVGRNLVWYN